MMDKTTARTCEVRHLKSNICTDLMTSRKPYVWRHSQLWSNPATSDANFRTAHACKLIEQAIAQDGMMINFKTENVSLSIRMYTFVYVTQTRARVIDDVAVPLTMSSECIMWHAYHKKYDNKTDGAHDVIIRLYIYIPPRFRARALSISMYMFNKCDITVTAPPLITTDSWHRRAKHNITSQRSRTALSG